MRKQKRQTKEISFEDKLWKAADKTFHRRAFGAVQDFYGA